MAGPTSVVEKLVAWVEWCPGNFEDFWDEGFDKPRAMATGFKHFVINKAENLWRNDPIEIRRFVADLMNDLSSEEDFELGMALLAVQKEWNS